MRHRGKLTLGGLILVALGFWFAPEWLREHSASSAPSASSTPRPAAESAPAPAAHGEIGFHSKAQLAEHFQKHGAEFGTTTQADYLRRAQELRDRPKSADVLEIVRADGVITRFDKQSGEFLAYNRDLTIRTFFKPDDGQRYFERQAHEAH